MTRRVGNAAAADVERAVAIALVDERKSAMVQDVREGLGRRQKELPPKYFYDERGSELFERITRLPEYYLTRAERALLEENARMLIDDASAAHARRARRRERGEDAHSPRRDARMPDARSSTCRST